MKMTEWFILYFVVKCKVCMYVDLLLLDVSLNLSCLGSNGSTFPSHSLESMFNGSHGTAWPTSLTLEKKDSGVLLEERVGGTTSVTRDVLFDVTTENVLNLLLLEPSFDNQLIVPVNWAARSQFREEKVQQVLLWTMEPVSQVKDHNLQLQLSYLTDLMYQVGSRRLGSISRVNSHNFLTLENSATKFILN